MDWRLRFFLHRQLCLGLNYSSVYPCLFSVLGHKPGHSCLTRQIMPYCPSTKSTITRQFHLKVTRFLLSSSYLSPALLYEKVISPNKNKCAARKRHTCLKDDINDYPTLEHCSDPVLTWAGAMRAISIVAKSTLSRQLPYQSLLPSALPRHRYHRQAHKSHWLDQSPVSLSVGDSLPSTLDLRPDRYCHLLQGRC